MRNTPSRKLVAKLLIILMVIMAVHGALESAHAMNCHVFPPSQTAITAPDLSAPNDCPCNPPTEQQEESDCCDTCLNCSCHTLLSSHRLLLRYAPLVLKVGSSEPYRHLPQVFLSKFIPPQNLA